MIFHLSLWVESGEYKASMHQGEHTIPLTKNEVQWLRNKVKKLYAPLAEIELSTEDTDQEPDCWIP